LRLLRQDFCAYLLGVAAGGFALGMLWTVAFLLSPLLAAVFYPFPPLYKYYV